MGAITFTPSTLLSQAFRLTGVLSQGEPMDADMATDGLALFNGLIDNLQTQRLALPASGRDVYTFVNGQSTYTIGPDGADWTAPRPVSIDYVNVLNRLAAIPFEIPLDSLDDQSFAAVTQKTLTSNFPFQYYWNATTPNGSIFFWPTPTDVATYQAVLYTPTQLSTFMYLVTSVSMAPGYYRMLLYNIAIELAIAWGRPPDPRISQIAQQSLADIKRVNTEPIDLITPGALPGTDGIYNIYGDLNY